MPTVKTITPDTREILRLYSSTISHCFATAADRAAALGISATAIRKWDRGQLHFVKRTSAERVRVISATCEKLSSRFRRRRDVGAYLLHEVVEADRSLRPLDLVVEARNPEVAVELFDATRSAAVNVVRKRLPAEALTDAAWADVLVARSDNERALEEELFERGERHGVTSAL
jgi:hypothetical protein